MDKYTVTIVGLGNVGYWCTIQAMLAIAQTLGESPWTIQLIDFDTVDERAVKKGFPDDLIGQPKPIAVYTVIKRIFGSKIATHAQPIVAAAEAVPGHIANSQAVFSCVDAYGPAAFISRLAAANWQCRLSTAGTEKTKAIHNVEIFPPHTATLEMAYDTASWMAASTHRSCITGDPVNPLAGAAFPLGSITGALAVQAWLNRDSELKPYRLTASGTQFAKIEWAGAIRPAPVETQLPFANNATIGTLWLHLVSQLNVKEHEILIEFELPWAIRQCQCGTNTGFETYPIQGICSRCDSNRVLITTTKLLTYNHARQFWDLSFAKFKTPIGIGLVAETITGTQNRYRLHAN